MNGIVNVYKEKGYTSHDVVAKLRGILGFKKIGHTGTLDPDATGVLPVCIGSATKVCDILTDTDKCYRAVMQLGVVTDTYDMSGNTVSSAAVHADEALIRSTVESFVGTYEQEPPMYSAIKMNGQKLYDLARQGITVERKKRTVHIRSIQIQEIDMADKKVTFTVTCSKGTYIRSLCKDIGDKLGCGAAMAELTRTRVGRFLLEDAWTLAEIEKRKASGTFEDILIAPDAIFNYNKIVITQETDRLVYNGNKFLYRQDQWQGALPADGERFLIYDSTGRFVAIYQFENHEFVPVKMFLG